MVVTHNDPSEWRKRAAASGLEGRVTFEYGLTSDEEWDRMSGADVLALPRLRCSGYPMKLLNYLAAARPIVAGEDSARGMSHGRNGYMVTESRPEAFAEGLLQVLRSPTLAGRLAEGAAKMSAEDLGRRSLLEGLERVYEDLSPPSNLRLFQPVAAPKRVATA